MQTQSGKWTLHGSSEVPHGRPIPHSRCHKRFVFSLEANAQVRGAALYLLSQPTQITSAGGNWFWFHILPLLYRHQQPGQAKLSLVLGGLSALKALQRFAKQTPILNTWLWKFKQWGIDFMTVTFLPNNKVSHVEVLAVYKEWISSRGQRQFFYSCNVVMQNLKNRKQTTFFRSRW